MLSAGELGNFLLLALQSEEGVQGRVELAIGAQTMCPGSQWTCPACPLALVTGLWACLGKQELAWLGRGPQACSDPPTADLSCALLLLSLGGSPDRLRWFSHPPSLPGPKASPHAGLPRLCFLFNKKEGSVFNYLNTHTLVPGSVLGPL